jgi:hypothetical protein
MLALALKCNTDYCTLSISHTFKERVEMLYLEITSEKLPPCHRFIPLNQWRREMYNGISQSFRHHFPWYDIWNMVPVHIFDDLVDNWDKINGSDPDFSAFDLDDRLVARLLEDIKQDITFYNALEHRFHLNTQMAMVAANSVYLRLAALHGCMDVEILLPETVEQKGIQAVACNVMDSPLFWQNDKYERLLLAGFFGPDLDISERIRIFREIEGWLTAAPRTMPGSLAWHLRKWVADPLYAPTLLEKSSIVWKIRLEKAAMAMQQSAPYRTGAFQKSVDKLLDATPRTILEASTDMFHKLIEDIPTLSREAVEKPLESLLTLAFPRQMALAHADSGGWKCLILIKRNNALTYEYSQIEHFQKKKVEDKENMWNFQGRIPAKQDNGKLQEWYCGLSTGADMVMQPLDFDFNRDSMEFSSLFHVPHDDRNKEMELRLLLVYEA